MDVNKFKKLATVLLLSGLGSSLHAQLSQEPLLNRPNTVAPNLVIVLDDSGSMDASYIYDYGSGSGMGMSGPDTKTYAQYSPDVNRIYYDPRVYYAPRVNYQGTAYAVSATASSWQVYFRKTSGAYTTSQLGSLSDYHNTAYTPPAAEVVAGSTATYPNDVTSTLLSSSSARFPKFVNRSDCTAYSTACSATEEKQNYLRWKQWYTTRIEMAKTGLGAAFQPLKNDSIRLGYGKIGTIDSSDRLDRGVESYVDTSGGSKSMFFDWLYALSTDSSTPNLVAVDGVGKYYSRTDSDGPWATTPNPTSRGFSTVSSPSGAGRSEAKTAHASCRRSFSMLVTDGYWNGSKPSTAGNADNTGFSISPAVGPAYVYTPIAPYKDSASNTMADLAMYYWGRDLRTDLANRVPTINSNGINNPSSWQNVSFYAVTLGIDGTLAQTAATRTALNSGSIAWPSPSENTPSTIDDTWHATINGRGELLNAKNSSQLTTGMNKMFTTIAGTPQTLSGVAVSTTFLKNGTRKYKPEYIPGSWQGRLSALELDATTGNDKVPTNVYWQVEQGVDASGDPISTIPAAASRNIVTWSGSSAVAFSASATGLDTDLVSYLRGDSSKELRKAGGVYRNRESKLGDIVNSSPAFVLNNVDLSYEKLSPAQGDYRAFVAAKAARTEGVLFVGANDGMLHGFRDSTGVESFAFVPKALWPKLVQLSVPSYGSGSTLHQYFVDGPNIETDAFLGGVWKNVLLGTTGAGAKAVYALDVTNPVSMTASNVIWEVNSSNTGFGNLGYVLSDVQAGVLASGEWVAIFGNGFGSSSGAASLYVVNLQTGALLKEITVDSSGNGLGGVRVVRDATQKVIGAYAGDLKGNLWKFDLSGSSASAWVVGLSGSPLYAAGSSQPITATPAVLPHPNGGYMVTFGTGKFMEEADKTIPASYVQRLYGVWDKQVFGSATVGVPLTGTGSLIQQTISTVTAGTPAVNYYAITTLIPAWGDGVTGVRGWYINLPNSGQRVAYPVERLSSTGTFVLASTLSPASSAAADACVQTGSGSGWAYIIDGVTGSGSTKRVLDTTGNGVVDGDDALVSGWQDPIDGRPTPITIESTTLRETYCIETAQSTCTKTVLECGQPGAKTCPVTASASSGFKSREWRQLFMR